MVAGAHFQSLDLLFQRFICYFFAQIRNLLLEKIQMMYYLW